MHTAMISSRIARLLRPRAAAPSRRRWSSQRGGDVSKTRHVHRRPTIAPGHPSRAPSMIGSSSDISRGYMAGIPDSLQLGGDNCNPRRCLSTANEDEFDIPPLDLSTPSLSIPLPPNLLKEKETRVERAAVIANLEASPSAAEAAVEASPEVELAPPQEPPPPAASIPSASPQTAISNGEAPAGSFLSAGIGNMKGELSDGHLTTNQRGDLRGALTGKPDTDEKTGASLGVRAKEGGERPQQPSVTLTAADKKERLEEVKQGKDAKLRRIYPSLTAEGPPALTGHRLKAMTKIEAKMAKIKEEVLKSSFSNEERTLLRRFEGEMMNAHVLRECGLTPSQYRDVRRKHKSGVQRQAFMLGRQKQYYAEHGIAIPEVAGSGSELSLEPATTSSSFAITLSAIDPKERLEEAKTKISARLNELEMFRHLLDEGPPPLSGYRLEAMIKLEKSLAKVEEEFLNSSTKNEEGKVVARLNQRMREARILRECGVTPMQYRNVRREHKPGVQRHAVLLEKQREFYAEHGMAVNDGSGAEVGLPSGAKASSPVQRPALDAAMSLSRVADSFPAPAFVEDLITTQADGTILGHAGSTSVLATVVLDSPAHFTPVSAFSRKTESGLESTEERKRAAVHKLLISAIKRADARSGATFVPLQVEYRERYHASGKIPGNRRRRDNTGALSDKEVLAARVVDRTVRPWLMMGLASDSNASSFGNALPEGIMVNCEVQSYDPRPFANDYSLNRTHADPTALAINSTIAALYQSAYSNPHSGLPVPLEAAACVKLAVMWNGAVVFDPTPGELDECQFELLYAGTKDRALMLEFSANGGPPSGNEEHPKDPGVAEGSVANALRLAHKAILPIIEKQEQLREKYIQDVELMTQEKNEGLMTDEEVAQLLGLDSLGATAEVSEEVPVGDGIAIVDEANAFVWSRLENVALKLFGYGDGESESLPRDGTARIHEGSLLSKKIRGKRENVLQAEISRLLLEEFIPNDEGLADVYRSAIREGGGSECLAALSHHVHECTMKRAMAECAEKNLRADGRLGLNVVRPISATAPIFPDSVHGSALFSRGETQVLCTATVGAPREGLPIADPYSFEGSRSKGQRGDDEKVPVGSLRFLRTQAEMESDLNSRRVRAGRELTGDSGVLSEVKRAFLHYDFPDFSTGVVKAKAGASANRRAIGHGNLAEKAVLPALPHINDFPYTIRLTSEVSSSNGSSSMASACGVSLALLDAGVPMVSPVAGVSVGLAPSSDELLLDITGTEDHYGDMDFKICGTHGGITAMQLDVRRPLPLENLLGALDLAKEGRRVILNAMENECRNTLPGLHPRPSMKSTAPRVEVISFDPNRKRDLVGPGGAVLRQLEDRFDISLDLSQEGRCLVFGSPTSVSNAKSVIMDLVSDVEEGGVYEGTVIEIRDFGAVVELLRNKEGLLHVSEITDDATTKHPGGNLGIVKSHLKVGDKIEVLCTKIDHVQGSIKLSRKKLLESRRKKTKVPSPMNQDVVNGSINGEATHNFDRDEPLLPTQRSGIAEVNEMLDRLASEEDADEEEDVKEDINEDEDDEFDQWIETNSEDIYDDESDVDIGSSSDETDGDNVDDESDEVNDSFEVDEDDLSDMISEKSETPERASSLDARWMERYNELQEYKDIKGNCNVPRSYGPLGHWVKQQRAVYNKGKIREDRLQLLKDIDFEWNGNEKAVRDQRTTSSLDAQWMERYNELQEYKDIKGNCNVPRSHGLLGNWVKKQRENYNKGKIREDRLELLSSIGFEWNTYNEQWEQRYQELVDFKREHNHCNVPRSYGPLGIWVANQRSFYKKGSITEDRKSRLEAIGFEWSRRQ